VQRTVTSAFVCYCSYCFYFFFHSAVLLILRSCFVAPVLCSSPTHVVKYDYDVAFDGDLELRVGDLIVLKLDNNDGWYTGYSERLESYGVFPANVRALALVVRAVLFLCPPPPTPLPHSIAQLILESWWQ
jgi:hypothetical protein